MAGVTALKSKLEKQRPDELVLWEEVTQRDTGQRLSWVPCFLGHGAPAALGALLSPMERQLLMGRG